MHAGFDVVKNVVFCSGVIFFLNAFTWQKIKHFRFRPQLLCLFPRPFTEMDSAGIDSQNFYFMFSKYCLAFVVV